MSYLLIRRCDNRHRLPAAMFAEQLTTGERDELHLSRCALLSWWGWQLISYEGSLSRAILIAIRWEARFRGISR
jgi:hypothetical protein